MRTIFIAELAQLGDDQDMALTEPRDADLEDDRAGTERAAWKLVLAVVHDAGPAHVADEAFELGVSEVAAPDESEGVRRRAGPDGAIVVVENDSS